MKSTKYSEAIEDFLSLDGQIEYCVYADERMMAIREIEDRISGYYLDSDFDFPDLPKRRLMNRNLIDLSDDCFEYLPLPRMQ